MLRIGLTGGIGAGKSTVSRALVAHGAVLVDADAIAREVVAPGSEGLAALVAEFGADILAADGTLDRPALAATAFADPDSTARLNAVTHPLVGARTAELVASAPADAIVVQDIPLLVEGGMAASFALVVVVHADEEVRLSRLVATRGMDPDDARNRIAAQADDDARRAVADVWLDNSGTEEDLRILADRLWTERLVPFEENLRLGRPAVEDGRVVPADPEWSAQADRAAARLHVACDGAAVRIDHVGSTAVPGLDAVDVLDLQISVRSLADLDVVSDRLTAAGYPPSSDAQVDDPVAVSGVGGEADPAVWAVRRHATADPGRPAHVDVRVHGWPGEVAALLVRDWLRANPGAADDYADLKRAVVERVAGSPHAAAEYRHAKSAWLASAVSEARRWADSTGWSPEIY